MALTNCRSPFLAEENYPYQGGDLHGRICANTSGSACCLPCPAIDYVYPTAYGQIAQSSNFLGIVALILNLFLLATLIRFRSKDRANHLSIGLVISLSLIAIAFIIPLGQKPRLCFDAVTPNNRHTDGRCAATGAFIVTGVIGTVFFSQYCTRTSGLDDTDLIAFLKSLWLFSFLLGKSPPWFHKRAMHLSSVWLSIPVVGKIPPSFCNITTVIGIAVPLISLAAVFGATEVSYRLWNVCAPSASNAAFTWFLWVLLFTGLSWIFQTACLCYYLILRTSSGKISTDMSTDTDGVPLSAMELEQSFHRKIVSEISARLRDIMASFIIANLPIFFGMAYIQSINVNTTLQRSQLIAAIQSNNTRLLTGSGQLGIDQQRALAMLCMASLLGIIIFALKIQKTDFKAWSRGWLV